MKRFEKAMTSESRDAAAEARTFAYFEDTSVADRDEFAISGLRCPDPGQSPPNPIEAADKWARHVWHFHRTTPAVAIALPLWLFVRISYRITRLVSLLAYLVSRPPVWLFWRLYKFFGPTARLAKSIYWARIYPLIELICRACVRLYWKLYRRCAPIARLTSKGFWKYIFPLLDLCWTALRWCYWKVIYPLVDVPVRMMGFALAERKTARTSEPSARAERVLRTAFAGGLRPEDAVAWVAQSPADFDAIFDCLPRFAMTAPTPASLHVLLLPTMLNTDVDQLRLLAKCLLTGAPCQHVFLYATDGFDAETLTQAFGFEVSALENCDVSEFLRRVRDRKLIGAPSLTVTQFGPVVMLISALWGRVGSTMIFDAQTRFLIEAGAIVIRVYVDHNPAHGPQRRIRRQQLVNENLAAVRPHLHLVAERDETRSAQSRLHGRRDYRMRSGVHRFELELEDAIPLDRSVLTWAGALAQLTIVNHAAHMAFARKWSGAPTVLETHDVLTDQLDSHGWPKFVSLKDEPREMRESDQRQLWASADVCVNLSPNDHEIIAPHAKAAIFVRPSAEATDIQLRPWADVVATNKLSAEFARSDSFDVLIWGDWHEANKRAAQWYFDKVIPGQPDLQGLRVAIVGRMTRLLPQRLLNLQGVVWTDFVDVIEDFMGRAKVLVIADQDAHGISVKSIEVARHGCPFVATKAGMRGLDLSGIDISPCDSPAAFATDLAALLRDPSLRASRGRAAREIYARNISPSEYGARWRDVVAMAAPSFGTTTMREIRVLPSKERGPALAMRELWRAEQTALHSAQTAKHDSDEQIVRAPVGATQRKRAVGVPACELSVVVCTYSRYDVLPGAIESLLRQNISETDIDILVVDNSPDQKAATEFGKRYDGTRVRYILEPIAGLSNARNVGADASNSKYVAYIDDDAVADPSWARNLVSGFRRFSPRAGVAGGRVVPRWITPRPEWLADELVGNLSIVDWGGSARTLGATEWIAGCNIAFERETLLEVGAFSRSLGRVGAGITLLSNEESAVIEKFADIDRSAIYLPDATVEHLIEPTRLDQEWFRRRAAWQAVSDYIKDPKKSSKYAGAAAERLRRELLSEQNTLPPGFVHPDVAREQFRHDVGIVYDLVIAMLAGGVELNEDGASSATLQDKLLASVRREMQRNPQLRSTIRKLANI
jgi:hypothetical protein